MVPVKSLFKFDNSNKNRMKLRYILLTFFMAGTLLSSTAQVHLQISSLSRFPVSPTDTAYESLTYDSIMIQVQNIGNTILNADNISILILGTPATGPDILYEDTNALYTLQGGSTALINASGFVFKPTHFDDGDNIVVVWPQARTTPHISDSLTFHVYYVSLLGSLTNIEEEPIIISPNPLNDFVALEIPSNLGAKQVRIVDIMGRTIISLNEGFNYIPTSDWTPGMYILQYINKSGHPVSKRLMKR
jgi:hypothetical protein